MNNYILTAFFLFSFSVVYGQQQQTPNVLAQMTAQQKTSFQAIHQNFRTQLDSLSSVNDPFVRKVRLQKIRLVRDSSLKALMGEELYRQYHRTVPKSSN